MGDRLFTTDGSLLEAQWDRPDYPSMAVVFCHPDPVQDGTMDAPLMVTVTKRLVERGLSVLRFNFRGVGTSTGTHGGGDAEVADVEAAMRAAGQTELSLGLAGWSFGAAVALRWLAESQRPIPYVGIAPPPRLLPDPAYLPASPKRIILGERDELAEEAPLRSYAERIGAELEVLPGSDHFFYLRKERVADLMADFMLSVTGAGTPG